MTRLPGATFDPYGADNPFGFPGLPMPKRPPAQEPEEPSQQELGILPHILGGAQFIGETLDKPGAAVRGLLAGHPEQLANAIPFSDSLGLTNAPPGAKSVFGTEPFTSEGSKTYGSDLLQSATGWKAPEEWSWGNAAEKLAHGAAGLGIDIATDPLTWVTGPLGMMSRAEKAANEVAIGTKAGDLRDVVNLLKDPATGPGGVMSAVGKLPTVFAGNPAVYADEIRQGNRSLFGVGAPWSSEPALEFNLMPKEWAANIIEKGFYGKYSPVNWFRGVFSKSVAEQKMTFQPAQQVRNDLLYTANKYYESAAQNMYHSLADSEAQLTKEWGDVFGHLEANGDKEGAQTFLRTMVEAYDKQPSADAFKTEIERIGILPGTPAAKVQALAQRVHEMHSAVNDVSDFLLDRLQEYGGDTKELQDIYAEYGHRGSTAGAQKAALKKQLVAGAGPNPFTPRQDAYRNVPGGTPAINAMTMDETWRGKRAVDNGFEDLTKANHLDVMKKPLQEALDNGDPLLFDPQVLNSKSIDDVRAAYANQVHLSDYLEKSWTDPNEVRTLPALERGQPDRTFTKASETARWMQGDATKSLMNAIDATGDQTLTTGVFDRTVMSDQHAYNLAMMRRIASLTSAHTFLGRDGVVGRAGENAVGRELSKAWYEAGFRKPGLEKFVETNYGDELHSAMNEELGLAKDATPDMQQQAIQNLASIKSQNGNMAMADALKAAQQETRSKAAAGIIKDLRLHPEAEGALKAYQAGMQPKNQNAILNMLDSLKGFYQRMLYNVFPQTMVRDAISHLFNHWSQGETSLTNILSGNNDARKFLTTKGGGEASEHLHELLGMGGIKGSDLEEMLQKSGQTNLPYGGFWSNMMKGPLPTKTYEAGNTTRIGAPTWLSKLSDLNPLSAVDRGMTRNRNYLNFIQRGGYYVALRREGLDPAAALAKMLNASFDYGENSKFGKDVMNRAYLFWGYRSKNIPYQISNVLAQPGGRTAQTLKAMAQLGGNVNAPGQPYTPAFLQERENIPVGGTPENQSFFSTSAIPFQDLNDIVTGKGLGGDITRSAEKLTAGVAPYLLWPAELAAGKQFSTGRKLTDLQSPTGSPAWDTFLHYSPLSRFESTEESVRHPGKSGSQAGLGLSGLGNVGTYDTQRAQLADLRDAYAQRMQDQGQKPWTDYYLPKATAAAMTPEQLKEASQTRQRSEQLTKLAKALADKRAKALAQGATP